MSFWAISVKLIFNEFWLFDIKFYIILVFLLCAKIRFALFIILNFNKLNKIEGNWTLFCFGIFKLNIFLFGILYYWVYK